MARRRIVLVLLTWLLVSVLAVPVHAQTAGPEPEPYVHVVQQGETLFSISRSYGLTVDAVSEANGIADPRKIYVGQRLVIPGQPQPVAEDGTTAHVVLAGDSLISIAQRYGTSWGRLAEVNHLVSPNALYVGQVIRVPVAGLVGGAQTADSSTGRGVGYVVRSDDTAYAIALRYGISSWTLAKASRVRNPALITPGQELVVPGEGGGPLPAPFTWVDVRPLPVQPGMTMVVLVQTSEPVTLVGRLFDQELRFGEENGVYYGVIGAHVFTEPGLYMLELSAVDAEQRTTTISTGIVVDEGSVRYERIDVPASRTDLLAPEVLSAEQARLSAAVAVFSSVRQWDVTLQRPTVGTISSYFGTHRSYGGGPYTSYHSGTDFRAPAGAPVYASAAGTVVLAEPLAIHGNMVIVDHGWGVLTGYAHLSAMAVQVGQTVAAGELLGNVGNTGLSTGAHLHWEVWVGGVSVNGLQWLEEFYPWSALRPAVGG